MFIPEISLTIFDYFVHAHYIEFKTFVLQVLIRQHKRNLRAGEVYSSQALLSVGMKWLFLDSMCTFIPDYLNPLLTTHGEWMCSAAIQLRSSRNDWRMSSCDLLFFLNVFCHRAE